MGKRAPFILDRDDFKRMLEILPPSERRDKLADRLREAHDAYQTQFARRSQLLKDLEEVGRKLTDDPGDTKTGARAAALSAEWGVYPKVLGERARAYADALTAWGSVTYNDFKFVGDAATDQINAQTHAWNDAARRDANLPYGSPERKQNEAEIQRLKAEAAPHYRTRTTCVNGMGAVEVAMSFSLGGRVVHGRLQSGDIDRFVKRVVERAA